MQPAKATAESTIEVTLYQPSDLEDLIKLFEANTPVYFHPSEIEELLKYIHENAATYYIARLNGIAVGACGYHYTIANEGRISWTFVHPSYKGLSIGKKLVSRCLDLLKEKTVSKITVWTSNLSWKFYEKFGFNLIKIEKDHWAKDLDLYYMEMSG